MAETTLISTFYSIEPLILPVHTLSPKKIILLIGDITDPLEEKRVEQNIKHIETVYKGVAEIKKIRLKGDTILDIAKQIVGIIDGEKEVVVNISGGIRLHALGALYASYVRKNKVSKIVCSDIVKGTLVELPQLTFGLTNAKRELLGELALQEKVSVAKIAEKMGKTRDLLYQQLKELKESGFVDEDFKVTEAGRLALL